MIPAVFQAPSVQPYEIRSDVMQPTLRHGDFLMVRPADRYDYDGIYILDFLGNGIGSPYRADRVVGSKEPLVRIWHDNPLYSRHTVGLDQFNEAVIGKALAEVRMKVSRSELLELAA